jgi:hypothetical protein
VTVLELSDSWWVRDDPEHPAEDNFAAMLQEIEVELGPDHELAGQIARVEARFGPSDDVIVGLIDGTFALVHPTWKGSREVSPWPEATRLGDAVAASEAIKAWEQYR